MRLMPALSFQGEQMMSTQRSRAQVVVVIVRVSTYRLGTVLLAVDAVGGHGGLVGRLAKQAARLGAETNTGQYQSWCRATVRLLDLPGHVEPVFAAGLAAVDVGVRADGARLARRRRLGSRVGRGGGRVVGVRAQRVRYAAAARRARLAERAFLNNAPIVEKASVSATCGGDEQ